MTDKIRFNFNICFVMDPRCQGWPLEVFISKFWFLCTKHHWLWFRHTKVSYLLDCDENKTAYKKKFFFARSVGNGVSTNLVIRRFIVSFARILNLKNRSRVRLFSSFNLFDSTRLATIQLNAAKLQLRGPERRSNKMIKIAVVLWCKISTCLAVLREKLRNIQLQQT